MSETANVATVEETKVITIENASSPAEWRKLIQEASNKVSVAIAESASKEVVSELREEVYKLKEARGKHRYGYENPPAASA